MLQCGPVVNVHLPKDRVSQAHQGFGFVEYATEDDAEYASKIMNNIMLYGKRIRVNKATADKRTNPDGTPATSNGVGAELFIGNLDFMVDENVLFETFSRFGPLVNHPKVARDENMLSRGFGFVSFTSFDASDDAIANMNGQYLMNKDITVQYAYKKDGKNERHGDEAERALAKQAQKHGLEVQVAPPPVVPMQTQPMVQPMMGMPNGYMNGGPVMPPQGFMPGYGYGRRRINLIYSIADDSVGPSPVQGLGFAPPAPRPYAQTPLQPPNALAGLPARPPPPSGYGGPMPPGMPPAFSPPGLPSQGFMPPGLPPHYPPPPS